MKKSIFALGFIFAQLAQADQLAEVRTLKIIFAENQTVAGFNTNEGLSQCLYQIMYIDLSNEAGKAQLSMVLSAKAAKQNIVRMTYSVDTQGKCNLTGLQIQ